ncbi:hypothetical protein AGMMS50218_15160 [Actinomycetota bacterium]|nr:hypothetical protein AGMMS50218_15160 [Actinomycetota bacterium]
MDTEHTMTTVADLAARQPGTLVVFDVGHGPTRRVAFEAVVLSAGGAVHFQQPGDRAAYEPARLGDLLPGRVAWAPGQVGGGRDGHPERQVTTVEELRAASLGDAAVFDVAGVGMTFVATPTQAGIGWRAPGQTQVHDAGAMAPYLPATLVWHGPATVARAVQIAAVDRTIPVVDRGTWGTVTDPSGQDGTEYDAAQWTTDPGDPGVSRIPPARAAFYEALCDPLVDDATIMALARAGEISRFLDGRTLADPAGLRWTIEDTLVREDEELMWWHDEHTGPDGQPVRSAPAPGARYGDQGGPAGPGSFLARVRAQQASPTPASADLQTGGPR